MLNTQQAHHQAEGRGWVGAWACEAAAAFEERLV